ncbi:hypothetical protein KAR91_04040 [Candidatus Pacearchaeota archaeon]|nr:hypothetical protein [Candidatus Pacearchaeota archaeon]
MIKRPNHHAERVFAEYLESQNKTWIYEPCQIDIGVPCKKHKRNKTYTPDFWCPEDNCYYEVSNTRQAYQQSMKKIILVLNKYHDIKIFVVLPDGRRYLSRKRYHMDRIKFSPINVTSLLKEKRITRVRLSFISGIPIYTIKQYLDQNEEISLIELQAIKKAILKERKMPILKY